MAVDGQRARFVDDLRPGRETKKSDAPAVAVRIPSAHPDLGHETGVIWQKTAALAILPVISQMLEHLFAARDPLADLVRHPAGQHRILAQERRGVRRLLEPLHEDRKTLVRRLSRESPLQSRDV